MTTNRVPSGETAKAVQAARPPAGFGPSSRAFFRGLAELRPPLPVGVAGVLMTVPVLALAVGSVAVVVRGFSVGFWQGLFSLLFGLVLFTLAGLGWRGVKRTVHLGSYEDGFFVARLSLAGLGLVAAAAVALAVQGERMPWTLALVPAAVTFLWAPRLLLHNEPARSWPGRVQLRRGVRMTSAAEATLLPGMRPHHCGKTSPTFPAEPYVVAPVADELRSGWRVGYPCAGCGQPAEQLGVALQTGETTELGGGDLWWVGEDAEVLCSGGAAPRFDDEHLEMAYTSIDPAVLDHLALRRCTEALRWAVWATERLLTMVPADADRVPAKLTTGRSTPLWAVTDGFRRESLHRALARRQRLLAGFEAEARRRVAERRP